MSRISDIRPSFPLLSLWRRFVIAMLFVTPLLASVSVVDDSLILINAKADPWGPPFEISKDESVYMFEGVGRVAVEENGKVHVVWAEGDDERIYYRYFDGSTWTTGTPLSAVLGNNGWVDIAEENGRLYVIWTENPTPDEDRIHFRFFDGSSWGPVLDVAGTGTGGRGAPRIAVENGTAFAVWKDHRNGRGDIYFAQFDGTGWGNVQMAVQGAPAETRTGLGIAVDNGGVHIVWETCKPRCTIEYRFFDGTSWYPIKTVSDEMWMSSFSNEDPALDVETGTVYVLWKINDPAKPGFYLRKRVEGIWQVTERVGWFPAMVGYVGTAIDVENGQIHISWTASPVGEARNVYYRHFNCGCWDSVEKVTGYTYPEEAGMKSMVARNGTVHMIYGWKLWDLLDPLDEDLFYMSGKPRISLKPPRNLTATISGSEDVRLEWEPPLCSPVDYYLIYRSTDQRSFEFSKPVFNTSTDSFPLRTNWTDIGADNASSPLEYYYSVRAANNLGIISSTSNTAGKWRKEFSSGLNVFSLPLKPYQDHNISWYVENIPNVAFIRWMESTGHWVTHSTGMGEGSSDSGTELGRAFEISLTATAGYTFTGYPASMIRFAEGFSDTAEFRTSLQADVQGDHVALSWNSTVGAYEYWVFKSDTRNGLHDLSSDPVVKLPQGSTSWTDDTTISKGEAHYMVMPVSPLGAFGSSTYSVGVITIGYQAGLDTFALPLKPTQNHSLDWYCDIIPNMMGMAYLTFEVWRFHAKEMPQGVYDIDVLQGEGYQISFESTAVRFTFTGY